MLPVSFVTCSGRVVYVTVSLLEESDCSRLGTLPFPLVFGFRKMIAVTRSTIEGGGDVTNLSPF